MIKYFVKETIKGIAIGIVMFLAVSSAIRLNEPKRTYEEGFSAGIAAQKVSEKALEEAAMKWWAGSPDINGARERLCWNYYPPRNGVGKGKK